MSSLQKEKIQAAFRERMDYDELLNCMRCGFCLPSCPTYIQSGYKESQSPRGRIALMKAVVDGVMEPDADFEQTLNECLGCRACEPVCPAGVNYGHLLEEARDILNQHKKHSLPVKVLRSSFFKHLFPNQKRMQKMTALLGVYQKSGLQTVARKTGVMKLFPESLRTMERILPKTPTLKTMQNKSPFYSTLSERKKVVGFFTGCLMDTMFNETNQATIHLLQKAGCDVVIPEVQNCCGALHGHAGEKELAIQLAKKNIIAFENEEVDYIITNAGGCGAFLHDYGHLLKKEPCWAARAEEFARKIKDITAVLVELDFHKLDLQLPQQVVTYQDSCHLRNVQGTFLEPRQLLQTIDGVQYVEMKDADRCCGSAGIYNIVESEMSMQILDYKMKQVETTHAKAIVPANPGCLLQMKLGIEREGLSDTIRAVHIVDLLLEAYEYARQPVGV